MLNINTTGLFLSSKWEVCFFKYCINIPKVVLILKVSSAKVVSFSYLVNPFYQLCLNIIEHFKVYKYIFTEFSIVYNLTVITLASRSKVKQKLENRDDINCTTSSKRLINGFE